MTDGKDISLREAEVRFHQTEDGRTRVEVHIDEKLGTGEGRKKPTTGKKR